MKDIKIPKEVSEYEAKLIGSLTARQAASLSVGTVIMFLAYVFLRDYFYAPIIIIICSIILIPFIGFAWLKPYGVKIEKIAKLIVTSRLRSSKRGYKISNSTLRTIKSIFITNSKKQKSKKTKKDKYDENEANILSKKVENNLNKLKKEQEKQFSKEYKSIRK